MRDNKLGLVVYFSATYQIPKTEEGYMKTLRTLTAKGFIPSIRYYDPASFEKFKSSEDQRLKFFKHLYASTFNYNSFQIESDNR
jgi:hypothetical protein